MSERYFKKSLKSSKVTYEEFCKDIIFLPGNDINF